MNTDSSKKDSVPTTARDYTNRGNSFLDRREYDRAIADFDMAIELDPKDAMAVADRGIAYFWQGKYELARMELDAAYRMNPRNPVVFRGRGMLALQAGDLVGAIAAFTVSLDIEPHNEFALQRRAVTYLRVDEQDKALADYAAAIEVHPELFEPYADRALVFRVQGRVDQSIGEAEALIAGNPTDARAYIMAGAIDAASGKDSEAMRVFDRAIEISPDESTYLARARYRRSTDPAGERADVDAALKLNPQSANASISLAKIQTDAGDYAGALNTLGAAIASQFNNCDLFTARGIVYAKSGQVALAELDFAAARTLATSAMSLNNICWIKATAGVALDAALTECDASVAEAQNYAAGYDSRGFVLLRLGRFGEAITSYDAALRIRPFSAASLYGRGVAEQRQGRSDEADIDFRLARLADAHIAEKFADYRFAQ